eukprot:10474916-Lingulodinium_polyedra.AAC.1
MVVWLVVARVARGERSVGSDAERGATSLGRCVGRHAGSIGELSWVALAIGIVGIVGDFGSVGVV